MYYIIIGNIIALVASILMVYAGIIKEKKKILYLQIIQIGLSVISNIILGGITGAIINVISCISNVLCYKDKLNLKEKIILISLAIIVSVPFNNLGIVGFLPIISLVTYTLLMDIKDVVKFKYLIMFSMLLWLIYSLCINLYVSAIFNFISIITNAISIWQLKKKS